MTDLERLTAAFNAMSPWARKLLEELAMGFVEDFPATEPAPVAADTLLASAAEGIRSGVDYCNPITNRSADNVAIDQS